MKAENEILAETVYNIFKFLSPIQEKRFLNMIGASETSTKNKVKSKSKISETEIEEQIRFKYRNLRK